MKMDETDLKYLIELILKLKERHTDILQVMIVPRNALSGKSYFDYFKENPENAKDLIGLEERMYL